MKNYYKNKESSYLKYWNLDNLYAWAMSQKLLVNKFNWTEDPSKFMEDFIISYNEENNEDIFLRLMLSILKNKINFIMIGHLC